MYNPRLPGESRANHGRQSRDRSAEELAQLVTVIEERAFRYARVRIRVTSLADWIEVNLSRRRKSGPYAICTLLQRSLGLARPLA
jgi:hypothetical protein